MKFTASFALIQSISMQAQSGDLAIVSAGCQLMIGGLSIK
jgi:hypothetical protein